MHRPTLHTQMTLVHVGLVLFGSIFFFPLQASAQGLSVLSVSPASQAISAPADTSITVTFDRELDPSSVTTQNFWAFGRWSGTVTGTVTVSPDGFSATLNPSSPFSAGENVMGPTLPISDRDRRHEPLARWLLISFLGRIATGESPIHTD